MSAARRSLRPFDESLGPLTSLVVSLEIGLSVIDFGSQVVPYLVMKTGPAWAWSFGVGRLAKACPQRLSRSLAIRATSMNPGLGPPEVQPTVF